MPASFNFHGGDIFEIANRLQVPLEEIIDLSSNVSPFKPEGIDHLMAANIHSIHHLPEPHSRGLVKALAEQHEVKPQGVVLGAGTTELMQWLCFFNRGKRMLIPSPSYSDYEKYALLFDLQVDLLILQEANGFQPEIEALEAALRQAQLVFLCHPNNPTGLLYDLEFIQQAVHRHPDTLFVVDESYMPFVQDQARHSTLKLQLPNLVTLRSYSKIFCLPGLRAGWMATGNVELAGRIRSAISPHSLNCLAQTICQNLVNSDTSALVAEMNRCKQLFLEQLEGMPWITPLQSACNFVLCRLSQPVAQQVFQHCYDNRLLIRNCSDFHGLDERYIRFSISSENHMKRAIALLSELNY